MRQVGTGARHLVQGLLVVLSASCMKADIEMGILDLMKHLMFVFNVLVFGSGVCLFSVGTWVAANPNGFQNLITSSPLLSAGTYLILLVGVALSILGFLGCFGAIKQNRTTLLLFFVLVLLVFIVEFAAAALILVHRKQIKADFFLSDLQRNYQGDNASDVFSTSWNAIMIAFSCCGILGPDDFENCSHFQEQQSDELWPRACCTRDRPHQTGNLLDWKRCRQRDPEYINSQGCFTTISRMMQKYISVPGACGLGVLAIEVFVAYLNPLDKISDVGKNQTIGLTHITPIRAIHCPVGEVKDYCPTAVLNVRPSESWVMFSMVFAFCLYYNFD